MKRKASYRRLALLAAVTPLLMSVGLPPGLVLCIARDHVAVEASHESAHSCTGSCSRALGNLPPGVSSADRCIDIAFSAVARDTLLEPTKHVPQAPAVVGVLCVGVSSPALGPQAPPRPDCSPLVDPVQRTLRTVRLLV